MSIQQMGVFCLSSPIQVESSADYNKEGMNIQSNEKDEQEIVGI